MFIIFWANLAQGGQRMELGVGALADGAARSRLQETPMFWQGEPGVTSHQGAPRPVGGSGRQVSRRRRHRSLWGRQHGTFFWGTASRRIFPTSPLVHTAASLSAVVHEHALGRLHGMREGLVPVCGDSG